MDMAPKAFRRWLAGVLLLALPLLAGGARPAHGPERLPPIVFVSRHAPTGADSAQIPGLGPHGSTIIVGGRLLIRDRDGAVRELVPHERFLDVQDPDVSPDAQRIVFSGVAAGETYWSLWMVGVDGAGLRRVSPKADFDVFDPCWFAGRIVAVRDSKRVGLYDNGPAFELAIIDTSGHLLGPAVVHRWPSVTPAGALDPAIDTRTGRLMFSRWWLNPWRADSAGALVRRPLGEHASDDVELWQPVSAQLRDGGDEPRSGSPLQAAKTHDVRHELVGLEDLRLLAGGVEPRRASMAVQCCRLADGSLVGTAARNTGLAPAPGAVFVQRFTKPSGAGQRIAGAAIANDDGDVYAEGENLAPTRACCPSALPDGGMLMSLDRGSRGDFGLFRVARDGSVTNVVDLPGTLELDACAVVPHRDGRVEAPRKTDWTFDFVDHDVFSGRGAPPRTAGTRLRFYDLNLREPAVAADSYTVDHIREVPVPWSGRVHVKQLPANTPMFETLVDSTGRMLMTAHGPAQVRGFNIGAPGSTVSCRGCHLGHSTLR